MLGGEYYSGIKQTCVQLPILLAALYLVGVGGWMGCVPCRWMGSHYLMVISHISYITPLLHYASLTSHTSYTLLHLLPLLLFTSLAASYSPVTITAISSEQTVFLHWAQQLHVR